MTDSHAHLCFPEGKANLTQIIDEFEQGGGEYILNVGHSPETNLETLNIHNSLKNNTVKVLSALGIHPEYVKETISIDIDRYKQMRKTVDAYRELVEKNANEIAAIGECGLDYYHIKNDPSISEEELEEIKELQKNLFKEHIEIALKHQKPLTIHVRDLPGENDCIEDALKIVSQIGEGKVRGSFHSYTQAPSYITEIIGLGFYIGVNGIVTYPKAENVREIVKLVPTNRILLETDTPLLPPQRIRSNKKYWRNYGAPYDIKEIAETVAKVKEVSVEEIIKTTTENFKQLFLVN